jgi:hypothetical protein
MATSPLKKPTHKTKKLIKKLIALLASPNKGEASNARTKLERLMLTYEIDEHQLNQIAETKQLYVLAFRNQWEKKLLTDILCWVVNDVHPSAKVGKDRMAVFLTPMQYRNALGAFNHYRQEFDLMAEVLTSVITAKSGMLVDRNKPSEVEPEPLEVIFNGEPPEASGSNEPSAEETPPPIPPAPTVENKSGDEEFIKQMRAGEMMKRMFGAVEVRPWIGIKPLPLGLPFEVSGSK